MPPRLTKGWSWPSSRIVASTAIDEPGLSTFCSLTRTRPARMSARDRSLLAARPRSTTRTSRRVFGDAAMLFEEYPAAEEKGHSALWSDPSGVCRFLLRGRRQGCAGRVRCGGRWSREIARLSEARLAAGRVHVSAYRVLRGHARIQNVPLHQHCGIHDVLVGAEDGEIGAVRRDYVHLAVQRILGREHGPGVAGNRHGLFDRMTEQVHHSHCLVSLVCCIRPTAVVQDCHAGRIPAHGNGKRGSEGGAVIAEFVQTYVDYVDGAAVIIRHHQLVGGGFVLAIDGAGHGGSIGA